EEISGPPTRTPGWRTLAHAASPRWNCDATSSRPNEFVAGERRNPVDRGRILHELGRGSSAPHRSRARLRVGTGRDEPAQIDRPGGRGPEAWAAGRAQAST